MIIITFEFRFLFQINYFRWISIVRFGLLNQSNKKMTSETEKSLIFNTLKFHLRVKGCLSFQNLPQWCPKMLLQKVQFIAMSIVLSLNVFSIFHYFLFKASNFAEYSSTAFDGSIGTLILSQHWLFFWHRTKISRLIEKLGQIIAQSN